MGLQGTGFSNGVSRHKLAPPCRRPAMRGMLRQGGITPQTFKSNNLWGQPRFA